MARYFVPAPPVSAVLLPDNYEPDRLGYVVEAASGIAAMQTIKAYREGQHWTLELDIRIVAPARRLFSTKPERRAADHIAEAAPVMLTALRELQDWAAMMGGFEAPVWDRAQDAIDKAGEYAPAEPRPVAPQHVVTYVEFSGNPRAVNFDQPAKLYYAEWVEAEGKGYGYADGGDGVNDPIPDEIRIALAASILPAGFKIVEG